MSAVANLRRWFTRPPEPVEARKAERRATREHEQARQLGQYISDHHCRNHFAERLNAALYAD